jgi:ATP-dependent helicase HepA
MIIIGQRFMSEAEPELGLGMIAHVESKFLKIIFLGSNTERTYALKGAPLKRVIFSSGDEITLRNGDKHIVEEAFNNEGLYQYKVVSQLFDERELSDSISFSKPEDRLLNGQIDHAHLFNLRLKTIEHKNRLSKTHVKGFVGPKLALLPHQFYVANSVSDRLIPRVLLADEVGLGKTIEAGLIIHKLLITERVKRVLILVPDSLVYQWFIEMLKKFNLHFTTLNQETYLEPETNPFSDNELVVVNIGLLKGAPMALDLIKKVEWDLLVVDEAHQLKWKVGEASAEYKIAEIISRRSKGLLLLTATPEQLGLEGHFARLKLIDPNRFYDYQKFLEENTHYEEVARKARLLISTNENGMNDHAIKELQDIHGTGRIFFRNTRIKMSKEYSFFPKRILHSYPLESKSTLHLGLEDEEKIGPSFDLKLDWLTQFILEKSNANKKDQKILLITKSKTQVMCLETLFKDRLPGINIGTFHSGLSFIARDRQAQYFADPEGAQVLLCTEIGSEGRNFEFAHHLVLFDLPAHPDLLEQRIGRLDRIGQKRDIHIHVPYVLTSYEEILFNWYDKGLDAFSHCAKGAGVVHMGLQSLLNEYLIKPNLLLTNQKLLNDFIETTKAEFEKISHQLDEGRDILVELNSFEEKLAHKIVDEIKFLDQDEDLKNYMSDVFQELGVDSEDLEETIQYVKPSDNMYVPYFPHLTTDGVRITFDRKTALKREDVEFLTWDHPMVTGVMDLILGNNLGNSTAVMRRESKDKSKTFIECFFKLDIIAPRNLSPDRFVSLKTLRVLVDSAGENFTLKFPKSLIDEKVMPIDAEALRKLKSLPKAAVAKIIKVAHDIALKDALVLKEEAVKEMENLLLDEEVRLKKLREINPIVRPEEIEALEKRIEILRNCYTTADVALDSIRIVF